MKKPLTITLSVFFLLAGLLLAQKTALATISYQAFYQFTDFLADSIDSYNLTNHNSAAQVSGKYGQGVQTTSTAYQDLEIGGTDMGITGSSNFSMGGWFKMTAQPSGTWFTLLSRGNSDDAGGNDRRVYYWIAYRDNGGTKTIYISRTRRAVVENAFEYTTTLTTNTWYHIALTYDGANLLGYLNGASIGSVSSVGSGQGDAYTHFSIGTMISGSAQDHLYYSSMVADDVFVSAQAFSQGDIQTIMDGLVVPPSNSISVILPQNSTSTPRNDFNNWTINATTATSTDRIKIKTNYTCEGCPLTWIDNYSLVWPIFTNDFSDFDMPKGHLLQASSTRQWSVWAEADDYYTGEFMASSSINYFSILGSSYAPPTSTPTSTYAITCDPESGFFSYSFCSMFSYLFVPDPSNLNQFSDLADGIKYKPPIGYFYALQTAFTSLATSTTSTSFISLGALKDNIIDPIRSAFIWLLWLTFGMWLFNRIRHLEI